MKVFDLKCTCGYEFELWCQSLEAFESQQQQKLIQCPMCNSGQVKRLPSAPRLHLSKKEKALTKKVSHMEQAYTHLKQMLSESEDVGEDFAEEVRRIFYEESPMRNIHGQASLEETLELMEEGIHVMLLPRGLGENEPVQ